MANSLPILRVPSVAVGGIGVKGGAPGHGCPGIMASPAPMPKIARRGRTGNLWADFYRVFTRAH